MKCDNFNCVFCNWGQCTGDPEMTAEFGDCKNERREYDDPTEQTLNETF